MLEECLRNKKTAFIPFIVAGDRSLQFTEKLAATLVAEGADVLELGVPFTDAMADGPVIQKASWKAATQNKVTLPAVIELAETLKKRFPKLKIVLFSYLNPILKMGSLEFSQKASKAGVDGILTVDLPPEEASEYRNILKENSLETIFLASPTTSPERLSLVNEASTGFVYYISRAGVTGVQSQLSVTLENDLKGLRTQIKKPLVVGFGISTGVQAAILSPLVEGIAVGSAFVKIIAENDDETVALQKTSDLARELKKAIHTSSRIIE